MRNVQAVFMKQMRSQIKKPIIIAQAAMFIILGIIMTIFTDTPVYAMPSTFVFMTAGLVLVGSTGSYITEDKETMNLRFMHMAGVTPREYLLGTWLSLFSVSAVIMVAFAAAGLFWGMDLVIFLGITWFAAAVSVLLGVTMGVSKQPALSMPLGMFLGFGPLLLGDNEALAPIFRFTYTQQMRNVMDYITAGRTGAEYDDPIICNHCGEIVDVSACAYDYVNGIYEAAATGVVAEAFLVTAANGVIIVALFWWMHRRHGLIGDKE